MSINQCEKQLTIGFCQKGKNRNVIPVRVDADHGSRPVSHWHPFSVWLLAQIHFDDLKGRPFLPLFKYFRVWFYWETQTPPFLSAVALPWCGKRAPRMHWNIYAGYIFTSRRFCLFFSSYYISDATLRKFTQVNNSLIELNWIKVKIESYGLYNLKLKIYDTIHCELCFMESGVRSMGKRNIYAFLFFNLFSEKWRSPVMHGGVSEHTSQRIFFSFFMVICLVPASLEGWFVV